MWDRGMMWDMWDMWETAYSVRLCGMWENVGRGNKTNGEAMGAGISTYLSTLS
jgi:hypothetical protein